MKSKYCLWQEPNQKICHPIFLNDFRILKYSMIDFLKKKLIKDKHIYTDIIKEKYLLVGLY